MNLLGEPQQPRDGRWGMLWMAVTVAVLAAGATGWWLLRTPTPRARTEPAASGRTAQKAAPLPTAPAGPGTDRRTGTVTVEADQPEAAVEVDGHPIGRAPQSVQLSPGRHQLRVTRDGFDAWQLEVHVLPARSITARARLTPQRPRLRIDADVPGASVFLDRRFLGTTPVEVSDVSPGQHRLNVSAEGYETHAETIEVGPGRQQILVRFLEVKLDERLAVVHKHGVGSCRGVLHATANGLSYETAESADGFSLPFASLEPLQVDYLKKNLRVRQRGGRTYNFTAETADALLVFQKAVEQARLRL